LNTKLGSGNPSVVANQKETKMVPAAKIEKPKAFYLKNVSDFKEFKSLAVQVGNEILPGWRTTLKVGGNLHKQLQSKATIDKSIREGVQKIEDFLKEKEMASMTFHTPHTGAGVCSSSLSSSALSSESDSFPTSTVSPHLPEKETKGGGDKELEQKKKKTFYREIHFTAKRS